MFGDQDILRETERERDRFCKEGQFRFHIQKIISELIFKKWRKKIKRHSWKNYNHKKRGFWNNDDDDEIKMMLSINFKLKSDIPSNWNNFFWWKSKEKKRKIESEKKERFLWWKQNPNAIKISWIFFSRSDFFFHDDEIMM